MIQRADQCVFLRPSGRCLRKHEVVHAPGCAYKFKVSGRIKSRHLGGFKSRQLNSNLCEVEHTIQSSIETPACRYRAMFLQRNCRTAARRVKILQENASHRGAVARRDCTRTRYITFDRRLANWTISHKVCGFVFESQDLSSVGLIATRTRRAGEKRQRPRRGEQRNRCEFVVLRAAAAEPLTSIVIQFACSRERGAAQR